MKGRALRRNLLVVLLMLLICAVAIGTTLLDPWVAALIFTGMAAVLLAGGQAMRAFTDGGWRPGRDRRASRPPGPDAPVPTPGTAVGAPATPAPTPGTPITTSKERHST